MQRWGAPSPLLDHIKIREHIMDQHRRKIILGSPIALGLSLTGCGGGSDTPDTTAQSTAGSDGMLQAASVTAPVDATTYLIASTTDPIFANTNGGKYMVRGASITDTGTATQIAPACRNGNKLHLCFTDMFMIGKTTDATFDQVARSAMFTFDLGTNAAPTAGRVFKAAQVASGLLLVNRLKSTSHYDFQFLSANNANATITVDSYSATVRRGTVSGGVTGTSQTIGNVQLTFKNVVMTPTTGITPNAASKNVTLSGTIYVQLVEEESDWIA
jgi:hypothetical protein